MHKSQSARGKFINCSSRSGRGSLPGKACLGHAEDESHRQEALWPLDPSHHTGAQAPSEQNPGDPHAGADANQHQVAGNLEDAVSDEENARSQSIGIRTQLDLLVHGQGGKADVDPVEVRGDVEQRQQRHQPQEELSHYFLFYDLVHPSKRTLR